jgi:hypothetical protein
MPASRRELSYMNPSSEDDPKSSQETQAFDPLLTDEDKLGDEEGGAQKDEPAEVEEDKERTEMVAKEAMLRVTGGQL